MVSRLAMLLVLAALSPAGPAGAQDWARAGGPIFVQPPPPRLDPTASTAAPADGIGRTAQPFSAEMRAAAEAHGLDPKLLHALVAVESAFRPDAVSPAGAGGLTQLMPATAAELGVTDRFDPDQNLAGGAAYLARQVQRFGDLRLALAAYNSGPGRVARLGRVPGLAETRAYVTAVLDCYLALAAGREVRSAGQCRSREAAP